MSSFDEISKLLPTLSASELTKLINLCVDQLERKITEKPAHVRKPPPKRTPIVSADKPDDKPVMADIKPADVDLDKVMDTFQGMILESEPSEPSETPATVIVPVVEPIPLQIPTKLQTEDTGKIFERAICLAYGIPYDGPYKYGMDAPAKLQTRLSRLPSLFPHCTHTAKRGSRYDFTAVDDTSKHLSAKSTKKGVGKVAPQVIGQAQPELFCNVIGLPFSTIPALKENIQSNIIRILPVLVAHTFDCDTVYYNQELDTIRYISLHTPIDWQQFLFTWTCKPAEWNNSSTLKIKHAKRKETALVEIQFHTKTRTNMAIRWCYENFLTLFKNNLHIHDL